MEIKYVISPNFDERPENVNIDTLVLHYTGMVSKEAAISRLVSNEAQVSCHYLIDEDGEVIYMVPEDKRAWHAGISCWRGRASVNHNSIGIELVNPGHEFGYREFPKKQMNSLIILCSDIVSRYRIEGRNVVGHSDIAPLRKEDPGELFNWQILAEHGIGLWPKIGKVANPSKMLISKGEENIAVGRVQKMLSDYGYHLKVDGYYGEKTEIVIKAFKRHFVQNDVNIIWNNIAEATIIELLNIANLF